MRTRITTGLLSSVIALAATSVGWAFDPVDSGALVNRIKAENIKAHLERLQAIADRHGGTRVAGSRGYRASVDYVKNRLKAAGYDVEVQPFTFQFFDEKSPPVLVRTAPTNKVYEADVDFASMTYSGSGDVKARLVLAGGIVLPPTPEASSASGCEANDFPADVEGKIVLIQRGTCFFIDKAQNAAEAGAAGVILFNEGNPGRTDLLTGTLGEEVRIPVVGTTFEVGQRLADLVESGVRVELRLKVDADIRPVETVNVIGEVKGRRNDRVVVVGAHLDSVEEGPGINDNGSGIGAILEIAEQLAALGTQPRNTVRFAFWGAEEEGLFGSTHYVEQLSKAGLARIALNLNFDMLGSPNYVRFVYDGSGSIGDAGPEGSSTIEKVFVDFFKDRKLESEPTVFDGRSDYLAFIDAGIPAGGLFSGAEEIKTKQEEKIYGGKAGRPYDACYHEACDTIENVSEKALAELGKAAAHAVYTFAMTREDVRREKKDEARIAAAQSATKSSSKKIVFRGPKRVR